MYIVYMIYIGEFLTKDFSDSTKVVQDENFDAKRNYLKVCFTFFFFLIQGEQHQL